MEMRWVFLPLFVEVALTLGLGIWMGLRRNRDIRSRAVAVDSIALGERKWTTRTTQVMNCYTNQFELPVLFYALTILAWITHHADLIFVVMAWIFVISRLVHAIIHTTSNVVAQRGLVFAVGAAVLTAMWVIFAVRILLAVG
jgi:hypothetical protein